MCEKAVAESGSRAAHSVLVLSRRKEENSDTGTETPTPQDEN